MQLVYRVDAASSKSGYVLGVPIPEAASINLSANLPGTGLDVAVIPAAGVRTTPSGATTRINATIPTTRGVQISWRTPSKRGASFSRAHYRAALSGNAIVWRGEFRVELFADETATLHLLPRKVTLTNLLVDGKEASILVDGKHFATLVKGRGVHTVVATFQTPVARADGPPRVELVIPKVPVSRFELTLPGRKELSAQPGTNVTSRTRANTTVATVHVPLTDQVTLTWSESVPDVVRRELRANASLYHVIYAEEGVLFSRARVLYEVRRGETNRLELIVPGDVQVNQVSSDAGAIADWRVTRQGNAQLLQIFLDRQIQGELTFDVLYDRSLGEGDSEAIPLLAAPNVGRQRGMVALLSSSDLTLDPTEEGETTRVGENQLPSFVRDDIELTIAHTFKYADSPPAMTVAASEPERVAGRYDAQVDSLISLGDVTLTGSTSIELHVKSGSVEQLELVLPEGTNLLNLSAPSLRTHRISEDDVRVIELEFTQEMEGHFKIDLSYERILGGDEAEVGASTVRVRGADVEQGRIAVEASSAVAVVPSVADELSPIEVGELPRQLVLQTTNPILLAFKYVRAEPEPRLALRVTRHRVVDVQEAAIDTAEYKTLFTRDGLSVTTARFICPIVIHYHTDENIVLRKHAITVLVSEYVEGKLLTDFLTRQPGGRLQPFPALHLLHALVVGLECIHRSREFHGDLHSDNIIVERYGLTFDLKILDFFQWQALKRDGYQHDLCEIIRMFYDALGGARFYAKQPRVVKEIVLGLKRSLILKRYPTAAHLRQHLETVRWG